MNKNGFTLIEILAVVAILAILAVLVLPNVIEVYHNAQKNAFFTEVQSVYTAAKNKYAMNQLNGNLNEETYTNVSGNKQLDLTGGSNGFTYCITIGTNGEIISITATNGKYKYVTTLARDIAIFDFVEEIEDDFAFTCNGTSHHTTDTYTRTCTKNASLTSSNISCTSSNYNTPTTACASGYTYSSNTCSSSRACNSASHNLSGTTCSYTGTVSSYSCRGGYEVANCTFSCIISGSGNPATGRSGACTSNPSSRCSSVCASITSQYTCQSYSVSSCSNNGWWNGSACYLYNMSSCPSGYSINGRNYTCPNGGTYNESTSKCEYTASTTYSGTISCSKYVCDEGTLDDTKCKITIDSSCPSGWDEE